jgi:hypothetical protein
VGDNIENLYIIIQRLQIKGVFAMASRTLSQKIIEIVGDNPDSFDETRELPIKDLLKSVNHEKDKNKAERKRF